ncbi:MAG: flagellar biosynthesis protein FlhF [Planctomycetota bacterium]
MQIKTFTAGNYDAALGLVRDEFGSDGVVLHTRSYKRGGVLGLGAQTVVEITASSGRDVGRRKRATAARSPRAEAVRRLETRRQERVVERQNATAGDLIKRTYAAARNEMATSEAVAAVAPAGGAAIAVQPRPAMTLGGSSAANDGMACGVAESAAAVRAALADDRLAEELATVKRMLGTLVHRPAPMARRGKKLLDAASLPDALADPYLAMLESELSAELAEKVVTEVRAELGEAGLKDAAKCRDAVAAALAGYLPEEPGERAWPTDGRPLTIALVGPTGVGKTTTVAKLAAGFKLNEGKRVGLITIDTYRIAAVHQLRTYAEIIDVPLEVVKSSAEMREAVAKLRDCDVILIDTAGRAPKDRGKLEGLNELLAPARAHETHLVLSSAASRSSMDDAMRRFEMLGYDRMIFTKLDEAVTVGVVLDVMREANHRLSYVTTGQEVPHRIEPATPRRLAELAIGGELG